MKILVTGSTSTIGSAVVKELRERKAEVRALVHSENKAGGFPADVEITVADLLDPAAVKKALDGVDKLYLMNAASLDELAQGLIAYNLAKQLKLQHVVYQSVFQADRFKNVARFASKLAIENAMKQFDVPFTVIRPHYFFQNDMALKEPLMEAGIYPIPLGTPGISAVDVHDIAEATAIALTSEGHHGKTYNLVGPSALSGPDAASIWSRLLQRSIHYVGDDLDSWAAQMRQSAPPWTVFDMRLIFQTFLGSGLVAGNGDIEALTELLGHRPRSYEDFARETALAWQKEGR
jgi:uncharacterized protein YbjT (DUF2867 family)